MDYEKLLKRLDKGNKERISVSVSPSVLKDFKNAIKGHAVSTAIEELMRQLIDSASAPLGPKYSNPRHSDIISMIQQISDPEVIETIKGILEAQIEIEAEDSLYSKKNA